MIADYGVFLDEVIGTNSQNRHRRVTGKGYVSY